jgi:predicted 3-demethylubiquinone-9 3-methyltransferase (glyoxalase superfamily)
MTRKILTHLLFENSAEEAMNFYVGIVPGSEVIETRRYEDCPPNRMFHRRSGFIREAFYGYQVSCQEGGTGNCFQDTRA